MEHTEDLLSELFDVPIMQQLEEDPEKVLMIPKDCYERIMKYYETHEEYELCARLVSQIGKVSDKTIPEMIMEYTSESTLVVLRLAQIMDILSQAKKRKNK